MRKTTALLFAEVRCDAGPTAATEFIHRDDATSATGKATKQEIEETAELVVNAWLTMHRAVGPIRSVQAVNDF